MRNFEEIVKSLWKGNSFLFDITLSEDFFIRGFIILFVVIILYIIFDYARTKKGMRKGGSSGSNSKDPTKKVVKNGNSTIIMAGLACYEIVPIVPQDDEKGASEGANESFVRGSLGWERTNKELSGLYLVKEKDKYARSKKGKLVLWNKEWFIFENPMKIPDDQHVLLNEKCNEAITKEELVFNWGGYLTLRTLPYSSRYEIEVEGEYPRLSQGRNEAFLLFTKLEEGPEEKDAKDTYYLFEIIKKGSALWQGVKARLWIGKLMTQEEIDKVKDHYLTREVNGLELDFDEI